MSTTTFLETPEMRLIAQLCKSLGEARKSLLNHEVGMAMAEIDYALECVVPDSFFEHPEMLRRLPVKSGMRKVTCPKCLGYVPGHATGNFDLCICEPITT